VKEKVMSTKKGLAMAVAAALVVVAVVALCWQPALAQRGGGERSGPHYSVIETEGHNLIVTDNHTNTLYFYTIDKDAKIGSEMRLRGSVDLNQVGKRVIKPTTTHHKD
jgi:hypothetical protein